MFKIDKRLARGYTREYIRKCTAFDPPFEPFEMLNYFRNQPSRYSGGRANAILNELSQYMTELCAIDKRERIYTGHFYNKADSDDPLPSLGLSLVRAKVGLLSTQVDVFAPTVILKLHALGRLVERTGIKPTPETFSFRVLFEWCCFHQLFLGTYDEVAPIIVPTKDGLYFGYSDMVDFKGSGRPNYVKKVFKKGKVKIQPGQVVDGVEIIRVTLLSTFISRDMLYDNQKAFYNEFNDFYDRNRGLFNNALLIKTGGSSLSFSEIQLTYADSLLEIDSLLNEHLPTMLSQLERVISR